MATKTSPPAPSTRFFTWMRSLNIQREPGWVGGVAAGISTRLGIDPLIVRGIIVVVAILGGPALLVYAAAWLLLPDVNDKIHLEQVIRGNLESAIAGIGVLVLLSLLPVSQGFWFAGTFWGDPHWGASIGRAVWTLVILGLAVWLVVWIARHQGPIIGNGSPQPTPPPATASTSEFAEWRERQAAWKAENTAYRRQQNADRTASWRVDYEAQMAELARQRAAFAEQRRRSRSNPLFTILVVGAALVAGGLTTLSLKSGEIEVPTVIAGLSVALAVLALGMIANGVMGRRPGGAAGFAALVVVPLIVFTAIPQTDHFEYTNASFYPRDSVRTQPDIYGAVRGNVVISLKDYYTSSVWHPADDSDDDVYLFVGAGDVTVELSEFGYSAVDATSVFGDVTVSEAGPDGKIVDRGNSPFVEFGDEADFDDQHVTLHIYVLAGDIRINEPGER